MEGGHEELYNQNDAEGFIHLNGLRLKQFSAQPTNPTAIAPVTAPFLIKPSGKGIPDGFFFCNNLFLSRVVTVWDSFHTHFWRLYSRLLPFWRLPRLQTQYHSYLRG